VIYTVPKDSNVIVKDMRHSVELGKWELDFILNVWKINLNYADFLSRPGISIFANVPSECIFGRNCRNNDSTQK
jgi:hypothetical protein